MGRGVSAEEKAKLKEEYFKKAEAGFERMFGDGKLDELRTFVQKDNQAGEIVDELWQWMREKHLEKDEQTDEVEAKRRCPCCGGIGKSREEAKEHRDLIGQYGPVGFEREGFYCGRCRKVFFPLDRRLEIGTEGYSPAILEKIEYAGANAVSFKQARQHLKILAGIEISDLHAGKLTDRFGAGREQKRDEDVELMKEDKLEVKILNKPRVCAVYVDAGKAQTRQEDEGKGPGVRGQGWADTKVACLVTYQAKEHAEDPHPEVPKKLMDRQTVKEICRQMALIHGKSQEPTKEIKVVANRKESQQETEEFEKPEALVRTAVATQQKIEEFGWIVAAEAKKRGFYEAKHKAFVGDGGNWVDPFGALHFPDWIQVLDLMHGMTPWYGGASAAYGKDTKEAWELYKRLVTQMWKGEVGSLIRMLENQVKRIGKPPENAPNSDPRKIVELTLLYVRRNAHRMDYPTYRKSGLPISSAPVESLIKQFNQRVKGTEKFWHRNRLEAVLQSRAAYLSEDGRSQKFWSERKCLGRAVGRSRLAANLNPVA